MNKKITYLSLSLVFGFLGGVVGVIVAQNYVLENLYNVPLYGDVEVGQGGSGAEVIIKEARNVVVEQNKKINDTVNNVDDSIVAIFAKESSDAEGFYYKNDNIVSAFVLTSDGWLVTGGFDDKLALNDEGKVATSTIEYANDNYFVVLSNDEIFAIEDLYIDDKQSLVFLKIDARDLPVRPFAESKNLKNGELLLATSWQGWTWITTVFNFVDDPNYLRDSDLCSKELLLNNQDELLADSFIFNLNGDLIAIVDGDSKIKLADNFSGLIDVLNEKLVEEDAVFGVRYVNLSTAISTSTKPQKGALLISDKNKLAVTEESVAELAGFLEGDIILSVDGVEVDEYNDLNYLIRNLKAGDRVEMLYLRDGKEVEVEVLF